MTDSVPERRLVFLQPGGALAISTQLMTFTLLVVPLIACGIALVRTQVDASA